MSSVANYQKVQRNYEELSESYITMEKDIEKNQQGPRGNEEYNL